MSSMKAGIFVYFIPSSLVIAHNQFPRQINEGRKSPHPHREARIPTEMAREDFTEKMVFKQRSEGGEGASQAYN